MKKPYDIPTPCSENWNTMTPEAKGRYCRSCEKVVVDFTTYSSKDIIVHFKKHQHTCGRFSSYQLDNVNKLVRTQGFSFPKLTGVFTIAAILGINAPTVANTIQPKIEVQKDSTWKSVLPKTPINDSITITGTVVDENDLAIPSVVVQLKGTEQWTTTDFDGHFKLIISKIKLKTYNTLVLKYTGYETMEIQINTETTEVNAKLIVGHILMGEVVRYNIFQRTGHFFRRLFSKNYH